MKNKVCDTIFFGGANLLGIPGSDKKGCKKSATIICWVLETESFSDVHIFQRWEWEEAFQLDHWLVEQRAGKKQRKKEGKYSAGKAAQVEVDWLHLLLHSTGLESPTGECTDQPSRKWWAVKKKQGLGEQLKGNRSKNQLTNRAESWAGGLQWCAAK